MDALGQLEKGGKVIASLSADGRWASEDEALTMLLNGDFDPRRETGVGVTFPFGYHAVQRAAAYLECEAVQFREVRPLEEGEVS